MPCLATDADATRFDVAARIGCIANTPIKIVGIAIGVQ